MLNEFNRACDWWARDNADISLPRDPAKVAGMVLDYRATTLHRATPDEDVSAQLVTMATTIWTGDTHER
jgi:hypothetical protein